jgi:hypothetical protein
MRPDKAALAAFVILALLGMHGLTGGRTVGTADHGSALPMTLAAMGSAHLPTTGASSPMHGGPSDLPSDHPEVGGHEH